MRRLGHLPALDGLRGVAILLVLMRHTYSPSRWALGGSLGVDLFFVLSGFLITSLLLTEWHSTGMVSLRGFYVRRARRLLPALVFFLLVAFAVTVGLHPQRLASDGMETLLRLTYVANFLVAFTHNGVGVGYGHLWSLAEEEQFYLLWPIGLVWLLRRKCSPRLIVWLLLGLAAVVSVERTIVIASGASLTRVWFAPDTHADPILIGCAAGVVWSYGMRIPKWLTAVAGIGAVGVVAAFSDGTGGQAHFWPIELVPLFAISAALFLIGVVEFGLAAALLRNRMLTLLGAISYALYLWHPLLLNTFGDRGAVFALFMASVSYVFVESRFRRRRQAAKESTARVLVPLLRPGENAAWGRGDVAS